MELDYKIQTYAWGKKGADSLVATLHANVNKNFKIENNESYAELWLGTHVNGPSVIKGSDELLSDFLNKHPECIGSNHVRKMFGTELPFLFKVLSIDKALSVQVHPSKKHAEELHKKQPDIYKDPNHKPELAIALTPFEALCGFRPLPDVVYYLKHIPELRAVTGNIAEKHKTNGIQMVKDAFKAVLEAPKNVIEEQLVLLLRRFKTLDKKEREFQYADVIRALYSQYPNDVGCFMVYFLNYIKLKPFEAIYLGANLPHAYLYGDCVECMACSDNVVRAGLTPKYIDVKTLCAMVNYHGDKAENMIFTPEQEDKECQIFKPPVPDFAIVQIKVPKSLKTYSTKKRTTGSTLLVISGEAKSRDMPLVAGTALFVPANDEFIITEIAEDLLMYQGLANI
ncbi:hypothetical protein Zmor_009882 [Zophobas morio]|uniref:mannose-6-phosphate isomerase n=1 Tax=Zophobas morio TaxID=2755281 RepID=A0AA38IRH8_9CUCU|nr:hypothetical protein Zmor_009882 [Zophobas morio]